MSNLIPIRPYEVVSAVDRYVDKAIKDAVKYENSALLDESGVYSLHLLAAEIFAMGYDQGYRTASAQQRGEVQRRRDRETREASQ